MESVDDVPTAQLLSVASRVVGALFDKHPRLLRYNDEAKLVPCTNYAEMLWNQPMDWCMINLAATSLLLNGQV